MHTLYVIKRNGQKEEVSFDKITKRIQSLSNDLDVNVMEVSQKIIGEIKPNITTSELDVLGAEICVALTTTNPDYGVLAARILISNHHKNTSPSFSEVIELLYSNYDELGNHAPMINEEIRNIVKQHGNKLNDIIDHKRDNRFDYFGFKTLEKTYLLRIKGKVVERPQYMWMRVALGIHRNDLKEVFETYDYMSNGYFIHATPTLFNAGTMNEQLSSCFLLMMREDSINGIYDTLKQCALISKSAGGIGLSVHDIRPENSYIKGTGGYSNGLVPMLKVYDTTSKYVDQGGQKRAGSFAVYLEPHHPDIMAFLELKKNNGAEEMRARNLFYALWISDLFMERVKNDEKITLLDPARYPGLSDVYGDDFRKLYIKYEDDFMKANEFNPNRLKKNIIPAREIWNKILELQVETGSPYMLYKDSANLKNNQANLGTIKSSNLCAEILLYTSQDEIAVCNLASICLPRFIKMLDGKPYFDFEMLERITKIVTKNLNKVIDVNFYPTPETERSNKRHRPIGIGIQGLADAFSLMKYPFDSKEARILNKQIAVHMYHAGVEASIEIAKSRNNLVKEFISLCESVADHLHLQLNPKWTHNQKTISIVKHMKDLKAKYEPRIHELATREKLVKSIGVNMNQFSVEEIFLLKTLKKIFDMQQHLKLIGEELNRERYLGSYSSFEGSPMSKGLLQYDLWTKDASAAFYEGMPDDFKEKLPYDFKGKFDKLKAEMMQHGLRNSTLFAYMPTATTAQIQGNNECFEPYTSNLYNRNVLSGSFIVTNRHLVNDLMKLGLWNSEMKNKIIENKGSVQNIDEIPEDIKKLYKIVWEISQKVILDYARDRAPFICMTQSMNLFVDAPNTAKLSSMHFYAWDLGLKTGMYYLRTRSKVTAQQFTIETKTEKTDKPVECDKSNPDCLSCGS